MATLHTIKAYLHDNVLTENPNDLVARVHSERSMNVKDICQSAATRGGADISASSMEHAVNLWLKEMVYRLCDGFSINTGWFKSNAHIKGTFNSPSETFNPAKHTLSFTFQQGAQLRKKINEIEVTVLGVADTSPVIAQVVDMKSGSINDRLTVNRNLRISGSKIKIVGDNEANGIYFVNQATEERIKVEASDIADNNPSKLIILTPALPAGTYKLEVTTQYAVGSITKEPRTAILDKLLTVP